MSFHRRRLPHWYPDGKPLFLTWHLHGSLPYGRYPPPGKTSSGEAFVWMDRYLDTTRCGPMFLRQEPIAQLVMESLYRGEQLGHYQLHAWVVMANHIHVLLTPHIHPSRLIASLKGVTARQANRLMRRTGEPFWQAECYDRWIRNEDELRRVWSYIENNPVKAGLAAEPGAFRWSSAHMRLDESRRSRVTAPLRQQRRTHKVIHATLASSRCGWGRTSAKRLLPPLLWRRSS